MNLEDLKPGAVLVRHQNQIIPSWTYYVAWYFDKLVVANQPRSTDDWLIFLALNGISYNMMVSDIIYNYEVEHAN